MLKYLLEVQHAKEAGARIEMLQLLKVVLVGSARAGKTRYVVCQQGGAPSTQLRAECSFFVSPWRMKGKKRNAGRLLGTMS